ncbi:S8 family serine peptidase [Micromonospora echinofusca]|uniref:S8 family serine peptidase n=1 Tax=Micromonospora echinofusca TaxID=47858 RepID=A0ABS3VNM7_MICEH|nr:S8 family serine peptidase [Micromonospora echinofusca]MBO4206096.1 S8 family serine peptidase [Micromonospora echinofusca]
MRRTRKLTGAGLALGLVLGVPAAGRAAPPDRPDRPRSTVAGADRGPAAPSTVTLLTGDRVTLTAGGAVSVRPGAGRAHLRFLVTRADGHVRVVPQDAVALLRTGRVDQRLFDVTELVESGYDDARRDTLPLLLTYRPGADRRTVAATAGTRITRDLPAIGGVAATASKDRAATVWAGLTTTRSGARVDTAGGVDRIWLDGRRRINLDHSVAQIGAPAAHAAGLTGRGVTVAVLDTGVDGAHPDLTGRIADSRNFSDVPEEGDTVGHGTHVASTIVGSGAASGGKYRGVAPDATLVSGKVCESFGCSESAILAGMHWAATDKRATVVNLSLGGRDTPETDPLEEAVETLTAQTGALFVIAAGNDGSDGSVGSPSTADAALSVGAVDRSDRLADFSSRGPRVGDDAIKPDITAPGVDIVAARGAGTQLGDPVGEQYVTLSGTSMATPHVAGAAALLAQQHPDWRAGRLKATLMASAKPHPGQTAYQQGAGRVDVARAITQAVTSEPTSVSFGRARWPHDDDTPVARTVGYTNPGGTAVTLDLSLAVTGPGGAPAPAGMFRLGATRLTVPAGGRAEVTVTADTRIAAPDGYFTGQLVARSGTGQVTTPLAVHREVESYTLTLDHRDRSGRRTTNYDTLLVGLDGFRFDSVYDPDGVAELRVPKGRYGLTSYLWTVDADGVWTTFTMLAQPELVVDGDVRVAVDARRAKPVKTTVPHKSATPALIDLTANFLTDEGSYSIGLWADSFSGLSSGQLGRTVSGEQFVATVSSQWADLRAASSPYLYAVAEAVPGRMPTGFYKHYRSGDLASVTHRFRGGDPKLLTERIVIPELVGHNTGASAIILPTAVPGQRTEYYNVRGTRWETELDFGVRSEDGWLDVKSVLVSPPTAYSGGRRYAEVWNTAPYGPLFPPLRWGDEGITRSGDVIGVYLPVHADSAGHLGGSLNDSARTALYRNGELVGETTDPGWGSFEVPAEAADYRVETVARRAFTDLATEVGASWTFRSRHAEGDGPVPLPAMVVRFAPKLAVDNSAPAGKTFGIPVTVERQPGAPAADVRTLTVDVSYDGGRTWTPTAVRPGAHGWVARVVHPAGTGHASLRATATDSAGNTVGQYVIGAYRLK